MAFDLGAFMRAGGASLAGYMNATQERQDRERQAKEDERNRAAQRRMDLLRKRILEQDLAERQAPEEPGEPRYRVTVDGMSGEFADPDAAAAFRERFTIPDAPEAPAPARAPVTRNTRDGMVQWNPITQTWDPMMVGGQRAMGGTSRLEEEEPGARNARNDSIYDIAAVTEALGAAESLTTREPTRENMLPFDPRYRQEVGSAAQGSDYAFDRPDLDAFSSGGQSALLRLVEMNNVRRELRARYPDATPAELDEILQQMLEEEARRGP